MSSSITNTPPNETRYINVVSADRLQVATRAWILWLQGLFKVRNPGDFRWSPNDNETEIFISGSEPEEGESSNTRPRLIVTRSAGRLLGTSTAQMLQPAFFKQPAKSADLIALNISIDCVAKEGLEAQALAFYIFRRLILFRKDIAKIGRIHHIATGSAQISEETPKKAMIASSPSSEFRIVNVSVPISIEDVVLADDREFYPEVVTYMLDVSQA